MLRREAVVDGDDSGGEFASEAAAEVVDGLGVGGEEHEPPAVEVDDDGKILAGGGGFSREEEAEPEVPGGVDCGVGGGDAVHWFVRGRDFEVQEAQETAVDSAVTAETGVGDGGYNGKRKADPPWKIWRCADMAAGGI